MLFLICITYEHSQCEDRMGLSELRGIKELLQQSQLIEVVQKMMAYKNICADLYH